MKELFSELAKIEGLPSAALFAAVSLLLGAVILIFAKKGAECEPLTEEELEELRRE